MDPRACVTDTNQPPGRVHGGLKKLPRGASALVRDIWSGAVPPSTEASERIERWRTLEMERGLPRGFICWACGISAATIKRWRKHGPPTRGAPLDAPPQPPPPPAPPPDPTPPPKGKGKKSVADIVRQTDAQLETDLDAVEIPADFDSVRLLKKIAVAADTSRQLKVTVLRALASLEHGKGRIPWETLSIDQIPDEVQHRLAGALLHRIAWMELPEEVRSASAVRRRAYRAVGVLPRDDEQAQRILDRLAATVAELRTAEFPEGVAPPTSSTPITLAAEAGRAKATAEARG